MQSINYHHNMKPYKEISFEFTDEEVVLAKKYLIEYIEVTKLEFDNNSIEVLQDKMELFPYNDIMHFLFKAIIIMKKN